MYTFGQLCVGDLFNTKAARWVKVSSNEAIVVLSGCFQVGHRVQFILSADVILLWSSLLSDDPSCSERKSEQPSLSESEKEDRFYREIEAKHRSDQAAALKQSLIDERDALIVRRESLVNYLISLDSTDPLRKFVQRQNDAMVQYICALDLRIDQSAT